MALLTNRTEQKWFSVIKSSLSQAFVLLSYLSILFIHYSAPQLKQSSLMGICSSDIGVNSSGFALLCKHVYSSGFALLCKHVYSSGFALLCKHVYSNEIMEQMMGRLRYPWLYEKAETSFNNILSL
jgi:ABC-type transporter Mla MlaB component